MKIFSPVETLILRNVKDLCKKKAFEIGCGDGALSRRLGKNVKSLLGIDPKRKAEYKRDNVTLLKGSIEDYLDKLGSFDLIIFNNSFHHINPQIQKNIFDLFNNQQDVVLIEPNFKGTFDAIYTYFEDCKPMAEKTAKLIKNLSDRNKIKILKKIESYDIFEFKSFNEAIKYCSEYSGTRLSKSLKNEIHKSITHSKTQQNLKFKDGITFLKIVKA